KVVVIGAGGLGSPVLQYLAAAGVGTLGIVDFDTVATSNLQRQVLYTEAEVGQLKCHAAAQRLKAMNSGIHIEPHGLALSSDNALDILAPYDVVVDGSANFPTRYLVNAACVLLDKPLVYGSIYRFEGQVSVFHQWINEAYGPNYRDLFAVPPPPNQVPDCATGGVLGVLPGMIGTLQANEVIKLITGIGSTLSGKLLLVDALSMSHRTIKIVKDPQNPLPGTRPTIDKLQDYAAFCGITPTPTNMESITTQELKTWIDDNTDFRLIDVREPFEYEEANMGGTLIPLGEVENNLDRIPREGRVVVHCKAGGRSANAIQLLEQKHGYTNLINLEGGILAWQAM
ncbi:MAG: ThiF family adenylyltransferase, partial [Salibacteraceae bacterium]